MTFSMRVERLIGSGEQSVSNSKRVSSGDRDSLTPAMRQYLEQKQEVGDAILLFRMGDFYETFYEDAKIAAKVLGIALTSRNKGENPIPLAGIPYHALDAYLRKLVAAGYRVAISEQVEDPKHAKGVVKRDVVRIITSGTLTDESMLSGQEENTLAAVCISNDRVGLATVELASGRFLAYVPVGSSALDEIVRIRPAELLVDEDALEAGPVNPLRSLAGEVEALCGTALVRRGSYEFREHFAGDTLRDHFGVATLAGFGLEGMDESIRAAGAILAYLRETQKTTLAHITRIVRPPSARYMQIDHHTWRALEIERTLRGDRREGTLLHAVDRTVHPGGARRLRQWLAAPLLVEDEIDARQDAVAAFVEATDARERVRLTLKQMADIERIVARVALRRASPRDLGSLGRALSTCPTLSRDLDALGPSLIVQNRTGLLGLEELAEFLQGALVEELPPTLRDGGVIAMGFDPELDRLRSIGADGQTWLAEYQKREIETTGIAGLKIGYNRVFGYYIEISRAQHADVPTHYVRRQTVKNAERYITDELKRYEDEVLSARDRALEREAILFEQIREKLAGYIVPLQQLADAISVLDVLSSLAELAVQERYVRPEIVDRLELRIVGGRHPVLDPLLKHEFVPNDCELSWDGTLVLLITGPNMAGKSTYIRQIALLMLLAQTGSFVPAESMQFSLADRVFARVGSADEIARGQSTFMVEMSEAANILNHATSRSVVILDELGRGTSTFDGLSLAWAVTEHLANAVGCRTLVATHYHELTELAEVHAGIANCNVAVREWTKGESGETGLAFLHRIVPGPADKSYGIHVAKLAGVPSAIVTRSREILESLEGHTRRDLSAPTLGTATAKKARQMALFSDIEAEVCEEIARIDPSRIQLEEIANMIEAWQRKLKC